MLSIRLGAVNSECDIHVMLQCSTVPLRDELDGELAALDVTHAESLRALAEYSDPRNHQRPTAGAKPPPAKPGARISSV